MNSKSVRLETTLIDPKPLEAAECGGMRQTQKISRLDRKPRRKPSGQTMELAGRRCYLALPHEPPSTWCTRGWEAWNSQYGRGLPGPRRRALPKGHTAPREPSRKAHGASAVLLFSKGATPLLMILEAVAQLDVRCTLWSRSRSPQLEITTRTILSGAWFGRG